MFSVVIWTAFGLAEASQATAFDEEVNACCVTLAALRVITPALLAWIQVVVVEPSFPAIYNCLCPVALPASSPPIITLPSPELILSPAVCPIAILLFPVTIFNDW